METINLNVQAKIYGEYDVVVCGGGTAGCVAALAAARGGAKTILIERTPFLGGMLTHGNAGLTKFVHHAKNPEIQAQISEELKTTPEKALTTGGIAMELVYKLMERKAATGTNGSASSYVYTDSQEFKLMLFEMIEEAGVKVHLHSYIFDVLKDGDKLTGVVYNTKEGCLVAKGKYIIDATGDGDVSALAGVPYVLGSCEDDQVVKEGRIPSGKLQMIGSMFRIGGVDMDRFMDYTIKNPDKFNIQPYGLMSLKEVEESYKKGDMIIFQTKLTGEKYHTELGFEPMNEYSAEHTQIYNYPRKGIVVGCITRMLSEDLDGTKVDDLTKAEYEVLYCAKRKVARFRESVPGFEEAFVLDVPQAGVRETRHILGEYKLNIDDVLGMREFDDSIGRSTHPVDIGPLPSACLEWERPDRFSFSLPYRILVAKGIDNLLLAGRLVSNTREAAGCTRPTVPCMITGEATGTAAAILCNNGITKAKDIDTNELRKVLLENGAVL